LTELTDDPANIVYVMSSRMPEEMERLFRQVNHLGLIAENGCFVRKPDSDEWSNLADKHSIQKWKTAVSPILAYFKVRSEGSWVEERHCSLVFHHGSAEDRLSAGRLAAECADHINDACAGHGVHAIPVEGALIVETSSTNKATAAAKVWKWSLEASKQNEEVSKPDFLLIIGDNREDEPVFRWANKLEDAKAVDYAMTVTLGSRSTEARATLTQGVTGSFFFCPFIKLTN
jgi:trehalose 6-phosphate synthase/phosphatase